MSDPTGMTEAQARVCLERLYHKLNRLPTITEFKSAGAVGSIERLTRWRREWAEDKGIADQIRKGFKDRPAPYAPKDLRQAKEEAKLMARYPRSEVERGSKGRPYNPEKPCPIEEAKRLYHASWRRIREVGA